MIFQENETVELKEVIVDDIKKEIIAFANCNGTGLDKVSPKVSFNKNALEFIIEHYTRESGV